MEKKNRERAFVSGFSNGLPGLCKALFSLKESSCSFVGRQCRFRIPGRIHGRLPCRRIYIWRYCLFPDDYSTSYISPNIQIQVLRLELESRTISLII